MTKKILFDTTYLLPLLGIKVKNLRNYNDYIARIIDTNSVYYHPISLIESKWKLIHLTREISREEKRLIYSRYREGLNYILESDKFTQVEFTNPNIEEEVDYLIEKGYRDYFDLLIFTTAYIENMTLITEDEELALIPGEINRYREMKILKWSQLTESLKE
jgi:PIN domain nuclease of toxin-antitoxin system